jgi:hypothetical protein
MASKFVEKRNEKQGQRRKRFLEFLRGLPMPDGKFDEQKKRWVPNQSQSDKK